MKTFGLVFAAVLLGAAGPAVAGEDLVSDNAELTEALAGREAGTPVRCIDYRSVRSTRIVEGVGLLYEVGGTIYLNRPDGAQRLNRWHVPVTEIRGGDICAREPIQLADRSAHSFSGTVFLGEFVPYRKPS